MNRYDPELPCGFQDADFETRHLESLANRSASLKKRGLCDHGWTQGHQDESVTCLHCDKTFTTKQELENERRELLN